MDWMLVLKAAVITFTLIFGVMSLLMLVGKGNIIPKIVLGLVAGKMTKRAKTVIPDITKKRMVNIVRMAELDKNSAAWVQAQEDLAILEKHDIA